MTGQATREQYRRYIKRWQEHMERLANDADWQSAHAADGDEDLAPGYWFGYADGLRHAQQVFAEKMEPLRL